MEKKVGKLAFLVLLLFSSKRSKAVVAEVAAFLTHEFVEAADGSEFSGLVE